MRQPQRVVTAGPEALRGELAQHEAARRADLRAREGQGAFYTPGWLVDLVVGETLRNVRDPGTVTVCDPTCGAGSFLVGARDGLGHLGSSRLCGVDLDAEAIALARARVPGANLVVGEALVSLDWPAAFPGTDGTFDVLVGNPPFVRIQHLREHDPGLADAVAARYASAEGNFDLYGPLLELVLERMRQAAGFVLPHRFFKTEYGRYLRELLAPHVAAIVDFGDRPVFRGVATYVCVVVLARQVRRFFTYTRSWDEGAVPDSGAVPSEALAPEAWVPLLDDERRVHQKLMSGGNPLYGTPGSPAAKLFVGLQTPSNRVFRLDVVEEAGDVLLVRSEAEPEAFPVERAVTRPLLMGADVRPYQVRDRGRLLLFPYRNAVLIDLPAEAPLATAYLGRHRAILEPEPRWWAYRYPKNLGSFEQSKILVGGVAARGRYAFDAAGRFYVVGGGDGGYSLLPRPGIDPWALLGVLASSPLDFCLHRQSSLFAGRCYSYGRRFLHSLPIRAEALTPEIAGLTRARAALGIGDAGAAELEREIDRLVGDAYGLDAADWVAIRRLVPDRKAESRYQGVSGP